MDKQTRTALEAVQRALVFTHNLRVTDLDAETFAKFAANGVPRDKLEWTTDHTKEIAIIDALLRPRYVRTRTFKHPHHMHVHQREAYRIARAQGGTFPVYNTGEGYWQCEVNGKPYNFSLLWGAV